MCSFFSSPEPPAPQVVDIRSEEEKQRDRDVAGLGSARAGYFRGLMGQPDFGYQSQDEALNPIYDRMRSRYAENVEQAAAERGFEPLRYGPAVSQIARGNQEMSENRAADEIARKQWWQQYVTSGGASAAQPPPSGRSVYSPGAPEPSPFASLFGPILGGIGYGLGGPVGGMLGGLAGNTLRGNPSGYQSKMASSSYHPYDPYEPG